MKLKKTVAAALAALTLLTCLGGCARETGEEEMVTLWVVTEESPPDGMNYQAEEAVRRFEETHENVTVTLEILPSDEAEREIRMKQLRSMIPTGNGPDAYLLPVSDTLVLTTPQPYTATKVNALFPDVSLAMYNGMFADISGYYDADEQLGKDALNTVIMDAGVMDGKRYVLPLRYDVPLVYTNPERWAERGLTQETFDAGVTALLDALGPGSLILPENLSLLPRTFDYEEGRLLLTEQDLADYMRLYQAQKSAILAESGYENYFIYNWYPQRTYNSLTLYIWKGMSWYSRGYTLYSGSLADVIWAAYIAKAGRYDLTVLPLRTTEGRTAAEVTYYGAVGSGSSHPELAYEFLRIFLTEDFQWERVRPRMQKGPLTEQRKDPQLKGLVENSWPVRTAGSVEPLWDNVKYQYLYYIDRKRCTQIQDASLTDEDIFQALNLEIDEVRFPVTDGVTSFSDVLARLNDENGNPTDADIDALAAQVYQDLWWHLAEG